MSLDRSKTVLGLAGANPKLLALFRRLDKNREGKLDAQEVSHMMALIGLSHGTVDCEKEVRSTPL